MEVELKKVQHELELDQNFNKKNHVFFLGYGIIDQGGWGFIHGDFKEKIIPLDYLAVFKLQLTLCSYSKIACLL